MVTPQEDERSREELAAFRQLPEQQQYVVASRFVVTKEKPMEAFQSKLKEDVREAHEDAGGRS